MYYQKHDRTFYKFNNVHLDSKKASNLSAVIKCVWVLF